MSSTYTGARIMLDAIRNSGPLYLGLFTSAPSVSGGGAEVIAPSYARQVVSFSAPSNSVMRNDNNLDYPQALEDWGTISHWGIVAAATAGELLWFGKFDNPSTINRGSSFFIEPSSLVLTEGLGTCA